MIYHAEQNTNHLVMQCFCHICYTKGRQSQQRLPPSVFGLWPPLTQKQYAVILRSVCRESSNKDINMQLCDSLIEFNPGGCSHNIFCNKLIFIQ